VEKCNLQSKLLLLCQYNNIFLSYNVDTVQQCIYIYTPIYIVILCVNLYKYKLPNKGREKLNKILIYWIASIQTQCEWNKSF